MELTWPSGWNSPESYILDRQINTGLWSLKNYKEIWTVQTLHRTVSNCGPIDMYTVRANRYYMLSVVLDVNSHPVGGVQIYSRLLSDKLLFWNIWTVSLSGTFKSHAFLRLHGLGFRQSGGSWTVQDCSSPTNYFIQRFTKHCDVILESFSL